MTISTNEIYSVPNFFQNVSLPPTECIAKGQGEDALARNSASPTDPTPQLTSACSSVTLPTAIDSRCDHGEILDLMAYYYRNANTIKQRQVCLSYIISYQHYNGEFSELECKTLRFPVPLCAAQKQPGYIRTEYHRIFDLIRPWLQCYMSPHLRGSFQIPRKKDPLDYMKVSSKLAPSVLKALYAKDTSVLDLPTLLKGEGEHPKQTLVLIEVSREDLKKRTIDLVQRELYKIDPKKKVGGFRMQHPNLKFVFVLEDPDIDLTILWGAKWASPKKNNNLQCLSLDDHELFGAEVYSWLNEMGAVPDRLAINQFITRELGNGNFEDDTKCLGVTSNRLGRNEPECVHRAEEKWNEMILEAESYTFSDDPGLTRIRDAIILWNERFFKKHHLLSYAAPLLVSQVGNWICCDPTIIEWTKAYQNLCEIVMFCLEMFPELCEEGDFEKAILEKLDAEGYFPNLHKSVGLYPYAMPTIFDTLYQVIHRPTVSGKNPAVACITHSYFETLVMMETMAAQGHITVNKAENLGEVIGLPDVLIADIHPNNAAKNILFQNDVAHWVAEKLTDTPDHKLVLILDITLNNLSDKELKRAFSVFLPFIENKQLELFCIYSLAKLSQLGADNFSGGACIYVGDKTTPEFHPKFPVAIPHKARFYALMTQHFHHLTVEYFQQVRVSTDRMYNVLKERFSQIKTSIWINLKALEKDKKSDGSVGYCAMGLTLNVDEETVYIAINFKNLLKVLQLGDEKQESRLVKYLRKLLLQLAFERNLPLTGRQSFGFSLSNMNNMCDTIRFTIGVENNHYLNRYADLVEDFCYALSKYTAVKTTEFDFDAFAKGILRANAILCEKEPLPNVEVPLYEEHEYDGYESANYLENVTLEYSGQQLVFTRPSSGESLPCTIYQKWIQSPAEGQWKTSKLMKVFFQITCLGMQKLRVWQNIFTKRYFLDGVLEDTCAFLHDTISIEDERSGITIQFEPDFIVTLPGNQTYNAQQTYVRVKRLGNKPVKVSKLDEKNCMNVFNGFARYHLRNTLCEGGIILSRDERKPFTNYPATIVSFFKSDGMSGVVKYLNELDLNTLPLPHDFSYNRQEAPLNALNNVLEILGSHLALQLTDEHIQQLDEISHEKFRQSIINGVIQKLSNNCSEIASPIDPKVAHKIAQLLTELPSHQVSRDFEIYSLLHYALVHVRKEPDDIPRLTNYFTALFPLIKQAFPSESSLMSLEGSIPLNILSQKVAFPPLQQYLENLEMEIPNLIEKISKPSTITLILSFYIRYPMSLAMKAKVLEAVASLPLKIRVKWVGHPDFYYSGFPEDQWFMSEVGTDEPYFMMEEQEELKQFFIAIGGIDILESHLSKNLPLIERWQTITNIS